MHHNYTTYIKSALIMCYWWGCGGGEAAPQNLFLVRPLAVFASQRRIRKKHSSVQDSI
jgi:hypothetical protein